MRIGNFGVWEILLILVVILLVFGPRRLPEMAKGIGQSVREFRKGIRDIKDDIGKDDEPKKVAVVETPAAPSVHVSRIEGGAESAPSVSPSVHVSPVEASAEKEAEEVKSA